VSVISWPRIHRHPAPPPTRPRPHRPAAPRHRGRPRLTAARPRRHRRAPLRVALSPGVLPGIAGPLSPYPGRPLQGPGEVGRSTWWARRRATTFCTARPGGTRPGAASAASPARTMTLTAPKHLLRRETVCLRTKCTRDFISAISRPIVFLAAPTDQTNTWSHPVRRSAKPGNSRVPRRGGPREACSRGRVPAACRIGVSADDQRSIADRPGGSIAGPGRGDSWPATG
jgi:hypothetical protein